MMTLSLHEGNPGHHLQGSHSIESPTMPFFRRVMEDRNYCHSPSRFPINTAYVEGWGLYAESLGFDMNLYEDLYDRWVQERSGTSVPCFGFSTGRRVPKRSFKLILKVS